MGNWLHRWRKSETLTWDRWGSLGIHNSRESSPPPQAGGTGGWHGMIWVQGLRSPGRSWTCGRVQFSVQSLSCVWLCDPMDCRPPGFLVHHQLPGLTQTHVHWVSDAIQPSHLLSSPSPPAFNLSQHRGLFHESVLCISWPMCWSFSFSISPSNEQSGLISFSTDWFELPCKGKSKGLSKVFSNTTVQEHQFFGSQLSL